jgi:hypothetical protein
MHRRSCCCTITTLCVRTPKALTEFELPLAQLQDGRGPLPVQDSGAVGPPPDGDVPVQGDGRVGPQGGRDGDVAEDHDVLGGLR